MEPGTLLERQEALHCDLIAFWGVRWPAVGAAGGAFWRQKYGNKLKKSHVKNICFFRAPPGTYFGAFWEAKGSPRGGFGSTFRPKWEKHVFRKAPQQGFRTIEDY